MIFCSGSVVTFDKCFFANNKQNDQYLFGIYGSGSITVSNSYFDAKEKLYDPSHNVRIYESQNFLIEPHIFSTGLCPGGRFFIHIPKRNKIKCTVLIHHQCYGKSLTTFVLKK